MYFSWFVDSIFILDIIIIFNSAYYDSSYSLVDCRKKIATNYLTTWFIVDFVSVLPVDSFDFNDFNEIAKLARAFKIYRLVKLLRIARIIKLVKEKNNVSKLLKKLLRLQVGFDRLLFFIMIFMILYVSVCEDSVRSRHPLGGAQRHTAAKREPRRPPVGGTRSAKRECERERPNN